MAIKRIFSEMNSDGTWFVQSDCGDEHYGQKCDCKSYGENLTYEEAERIGTELSKMYKVPFRQSFKPELGYDMVLYTAPLDEGISAHLYAEALRKLAPSKTGYMVIDFSENNTSAYGFIAESAFEKIDYDKTKIEKEVNAIIGDMTLESPDNKYTFYNNSISAYIQ